MPWMETEPVFERSRFVYEVRQKKESVAKLARRYGISRKTAYKWVGRYKEGGYRELEDRSREAKSKPHATAPEVVKELVEARRAHPSWGPRKLLALLKRSEPRRRHWPAASTVGDILKRAGLVQERRRRRRLEQPGESAGPGPYPQRPNDLWCIDFKGDFCTRDGRRVWPLTVTDAASRKVLVCKRLVGPTEAAVRRELQKAFRRYGLPRAIRSDNGEPFVSVQSPGGLSRLSLWWLKLGITLQRTQPGSPQQNGRHERMHRTLKAECATPPKANPAAQQRAFDAFVREYNGVRPHEALGMRTPDSLYRPSPRRLPRRLAAFSYPSGFEVRHVTNRGCIKLEGQLFFVSEVLYGEAVGLEKLQQGRWQLHLGPVLLGELHSDSGRFHSVASLLQRTQRRVA